jgi:prepilin-type N-terminal cleavage/methylation domain-containing protein
VRLTARIRARLAGSAGYTLVELLTVLAILGVVLGGIVALFTAGSAADADMNRRYQAQSNARLALDRMRRDAHQACGIAAGYTSSSVTLLAYDASVPPVCQTATFTWCTLGSGTRFALYRMTGAVACATSGGKYSDFLTTGGAFTYTPQNSPAGTYTLARLHVDLQVNLTPTKTTDSYRLVDDIAFRNSPRS